MTKILVTTSSFSHKPEGLILNPHKRKITEDELIELLKEHQPDAMIAGTEPITDKALNEAKNLKIIARVGVGIDNIDATAAKKYNIEITNTPDAVTAPVAELTIGLMIDLLRNITLSDRSIRKQGWERPMGSLLQGKTVGIIGCGRIGRYVAQLLNAFGCKIIAFDIQAFPQIENIETANLDDLLQRSDIVTLHLPHSEATNHLISERELNQMKKGSYLINAARGGIIDETALEKSLQDGKLAGAALDCFENEPYKGPLANIENVLLTAHIGSYAKEGRMMMEKQAYESIVNFFGEAKNP